MRILWDFDGTIFDTYPSIVENIYNSVSNERKHLITLEDVYRLTKVTAGFAMEMLDFNDEQKKRVYERQYDVVPEKNPPFPYVREVLKQAEINVIMTHKNEKSVTEILNHYGMTSYFAEVVTKDSGFPKKPHPASYRHLHERYAIDIAIGDRQLDLLPASTLGILTCSYRNHYPKADFYLDDYANFSNILLGYTYGVKSHKKEKPKLNAAWLIENYGEHKELLEKALEFTEVTGEKEIAYLLFLGELDKNKISGFPAIDASLYALEHGFPGSTIKTLLFNQYSLEKLPKADNEIIALYASLERFIGEYSKERIKKINQYL